MVYLFLYVYSDLKSQIHYCKSSIYLLASFCDHFPLEKEDLICFKMNQKICIKKFGFPNFVYTNCLDYLLHSAEV